MHVRHHFLPLRFVVDTSVAVHALIHDRGTRKETRLIMSARRASQSDRRPGIIDRPLHERRNGWWTNATWVRGWNCFSRGARHRIQPCSVGWTGRCRLGKYHAESTWCFRIYFLSELYTHTHTYTLIHTKHTHTYTHNYACTHAFAYSHTRGFYPQPIVLRNWVYTNLRIAYFSYSLTNWPSFPSLSSKGTKRRLIKMPLCRIN